MLAFPKNFSKTNIPFYPTSGGYEGIHFWTDESKFKMHQSSSSWWCTYYMPRRNQREVLKYKFRKSRKFHKKIVCKNWPISDLKLLPFLIDEFFFFVFVSKDSFWTILFKTFFLSIPPFSVAFLRQSFRCLKAVKLIPGFWGEKSLSAQMGKNNRRWRWLSFHLICKTQLNRKSSSVCSDLFSNSHITYVPLKLTFMSMSNKNVLNKVQKLTEDVNNHLLIVSAKCLWGVAHVHLVVSSNPSTGNLMDRFSHLFIVKFIRVWNGRK